MDGAGYDYATHYSYDIHGNVSSLMQDNPKLVHLNQRFKKVDYEYDLISGKVNNVVYQKGAVDEFRHKYEYDADNKLTNVFTSRDNIVWDQDAKYYYYQHGPLSRVEIGHDKVQGMDYAYNLQGWLKAVNSTTLDEQNEMGHDGANLVGNLHKNFAKDEFGFSLGYYKEDYKSIGRPMSSDELFMASMRGSEIEQNNKDLYNGNISTMVTSVRKFMQGANASPMANQYSYDQLNRLKSVTTYQDPNVLATNQWAAGGTKQNAYSEKFTYDANGNILTLKRNADVNANATSTGMDDFTYIYENKANGFDRNTNKLIAVKDATVTANNPATKNWGDIQPGQQYSATNKSLNNYQYDEIGNLIKDQSEEIYNIQWTVSGKIKSIERNANSKRPDLEFGYDAAGNRIYKTVKPRTGSGLTSETEWTTTYYTRDASGNQMAVYEMKTISDPDGTLNDQMQMKEFDIYGSSRLGVYNVPLEQANIAFAPTQNRGYLPSKYVQNSLTLSSTDALVKSYSIGYKFFEQSNHLGNVSSVFSDKKIAIDNNNDGAIDGYISDVISASDYYAFGSLRSNRSYQSDAYRYGFGGHLKDDEIKGEGNHLAFGDYGYDPRLGRRWNIEPHIRNYSSFSSYMVFGNNPINTIDPDGKDIIVLRNSAGANGTGHGAILVGDNKNGWTYISKDGYTGSAFGSKSKFAVIKFSSIEEFRNSPHNFETNETHSTTNGKEAKNLTFKLDENGNKIQRYDQALYIPTTQLNGKSTDEKTIEAATKSAKTEYCLMNGDCSDVVGDALLVSKDNNGKKIKNGNSKITGSILFDLINKRPNTKFNKIAERNNSDIKYDAGVKPDDKKLQEGEKGVK